MTRTPRETFLSDQTLATARDLAADPRNVPIAITRAVGGRCTWCDCPDGADSPHNRPGYRCAGCPAPATAVLSAFVGPDHRYDYPACDEHTPDIVTSIARIAGGSA